jgi:hypothetical protein
VLVIDAWADQLGDGDEGGLPAGVWGIRNGLLDDLDGLDAE